MHGMHCKVALFPCRFAGLVFVWLVAMVTGFLYKRFIVGAKGWEQVPLLSIYREFGNLEAVSIFIDITFIKLTLKMCHRIHNIACIVLT